MASGITVSERAGLLPFQALPMTGAPRRDQRDLMERPFFSLAKAKRTAPILYRAGDIEVQVHALPEHGLATIWDADILIWAGSQLVDAAARGVPTSRFLRFTPYQLLTSIGRGSGLRQYQLLKGALARLQSTVVRTNIRHGEHWRRQQFSWVAEWEERVGRAGRCEGMEFVLPDWFYRGVLDHSLILTIDPAYFRLTGGIERWLYRVARKHAGHQPNGWTFELRHLHTKSGSLSRFSDFAVDVRRVVRRQSIPGYQLKVSTDKREPVLTMRPIGLGTSCGRAVSPFGTSGAIAIGTSGALRSALRAHEGQLSLWSATENSAGNNSNSDSNSFVGARMRSDRKVVR